MILNKIKLIVIENILVVGVVLIIATVMLRCSNNNLRTQLENQKSINKELTDSLKTTKNKLGETIVEKASAQADLKAIKETYGKELEAIRRDFGIKEKNLQSFIKAELKTAISGQSTKVDTVFQTLSGDTTGYTMEASDYTPWYDIEVSIDTDGLFEYDLEVRDHVTLAIGLKRAKWYNKLEPVVSGKNANPYVTITGLTSATITDYRPLWLTVGPSVQATLVNGEVKYLVGVSAQVPLIQIRRPWQKK